MSGQAINLNKSSVTFSPNTTQINCNAVYTYLQVTEVQKPGKYLGMPMNVGRKKTSVFFQVVTNLKQQIPSLFSYTIKNSLTYINYYFRIYF